MIGFLQELDELEDEYAKLSCIPSWYEYVRAECALKASIGVFEGIGERVKTKREKMIKEKIKKMADKCQTDNGFDYETFAELIIKDCASLVSNHTRAVETGKHNYGISQADKIIKLFYGIK
jgi:hypothetical protein